MQITDFSKPVSSKRLNESLAQKFGYKLDLNKFTMEQLEDARNKLRTAQHQFETNESYDAVHTDHKYHKNKMFLDVINQEIAERVDIEDEDQDEKPKKKKAKNLKEYNEAMIALNHFTRQFSIPSSWTQQARSRLMIEEDADYIKSELIVRYDLDEGTANALIQTLLITEGEEEKAELIMASKDMVDRITGWLEDVAAMKSEAMLDLLDSIRDEMGSDLAMEFESMVKPSLATIYTALESSRQNLTQSVGLLTGENQDQAPMMGEEPPMDDMAGELPDEVTGSGEADEMGDDFGADAAAAGGEEAAGRMTRESVEYSRKLASLLAPKKK
jgi:hypothetical protein